MRYISLFSGIEAASVAWGSLGWTPVAFAEIDPFASAVLAHHWPDVPNVGDVTVHDWSQYRGKCDLVIGGSPCQAFSVAGLRNSLSDARGNLTLSFVEACNAIDPPFVVWEQVPGVLSTADNAFGCFLGGMVGAPEPLQSGHKRGKWPDAGMAVGPQRAAAWGTLCAQYFGVPQRRRRIFCVAVALRHLAFASGATANPAAVLFNFQSGAGRASESGTSRKKAGRPARSGPPGGGGLFPDLVPDDSSTMTAGPDGDPLLPPVSGTLGGGSGSRGYPNSPDVTTFVPEVSPTVVGGAPFSRTGRRRVECDAFVCESSPTSGGEGLAKNSSAINGANVSDARAASVPDVSPTVVAGPPFSRTGNSRVECDVIVPAIAATVTAKWSKGVGGPAGDECQHLVPTEPYVVRLAQTSSNGCGIGQGVAHTLDASGPEAVVYPLAEVGKRNSPSSDKACAGVGVGDGGDPMFALQAGAKHGVVQAVAFSVKDSGADAGEVSPTLRAMGHAGSHANGGGQVAVVTVAGDVTHALRAEGADASEDGTGRGTPLVAISENDVQECSSLAIRGREGGLSAETLPGNAAHALRAAQGTLDKPHVLLPNVVRRLTPTEAERLQGFPDGHTLIPYGRNRRVKDISEMAVYWNVSEETAKTLAADSVRYKAIGNSMAVPVIFWLGKRIEWVLRKLAELDGHQGDE